MGQGLKFTQAPPGFPTHSCLFFLYFCLEKEFPTAPKISKLSFTQYKLVREESSNIEVEFYLNSARKRMKRRLLLLTGILTAELSLRSKRFRASSPRKVGTTAKKKRNDGGQGGESRKRLPANSTTLKNFLFSPPPPTSTLFFFAPALTFAP